MSDMLCSTGSGNDELSSWLSSVKSLFFPHLVGHGVWQRSSVGPFRLHRCFLDSSASVSVASTGSSFSDLGPFPPSKWREQIYSRCSWLSSPHFGNPPDHINTAIALLSPFLPWRALFPTVSCCRGSSRVWEKR